MRTPPTESTSSSRSSARPPVSSKKNNSRRTNPPSSMQSLTSKMRPTTIPDMFGDIDKGHFNEAERFLFMGEMLFKFLQIPSLNSSLELKVYDRSCTLYIHCFIIGIMAVTSAYKEGKIGMGNGKYVRYTEEQVEALERVYHECPKPSSFRRQPLIHEYPILCNIEPKQIKVWFQNFFMNLCPFGCPVIA
ncbi:homeobox-leucine zipper family protein [Actinidia rufa]|uniref:Homeobox-leucine zipper family protein n=1 Tax=Actinidia rufa TaxID=165716 RepID=A0A7J0F9M9_9ERIC|nr:homeobox-leucine zipper family protein [Actinidia rufa]